jgi:hypothetical protein
MILTKEHIGLRVKREGEFPVDGVLLGIDKFNCAQIKGSPSKVWTADDSLGEWKVFSKKLTAFFILWCPTSSLPPTRRFDTQKEAEEVAESMVKKHSAQFYVLRAVGSCNIEPQPKLKWERMK